MTFTTQWFDSSTPAVNKKWLGYAHHCICGQKIRAPSLDALRKRTEQHFQNLHYIGAACLN